MKTSPNMGLNIPEGSDVFNYKTFLEDNLNKIDDHFMQVPLSEEISATEGQTVFNLSNSYVMGTNALNVEIDGVPQDLGEGFTETTSSSITLAEGVPAGSNITVTILKTPAGINTKITELDAQLAESASKGTVFSFSHDLGIQVEKHLNIFTGANSSSPSIYWCWVIQVDDKISNPLGKYYMFYSTDHADTAGYISLAYSNNLLSGWTDYGQVYKNGAYETETPSVVWDEVNKKFIMYFHSAFSYVGEAQTSWLVTSADGKTWANKQKLLDLNMAELVGDGHNGYFHPFKIGEDFYAYHLMGGGNNARFALSYSEDGYKWYTDHRQLGFGNLYNNRYMSYNHCTPVIFRGTWHLLGVNTNFVSGANPKDAYVAIAPLKSDFRNITGIPKKLFELDGTGESPNVRQVHVYNEGNKLYVFYQCDNNLHCAII